jgi:hypothetical protein
VPDLLDLANTPARRGAPALSRVSFGRSLNGLTLDVAPVLTRLLAMRTNVHHSNELRATSSESTDGICWGRCR